MRNSESDDNDEVLTDLDADLDIEEQGRDSTRTIFI